MAMQCSESRKKRFVVDRELLAKDDYLNLLAQPKRVRIENSTRIRSLTLIFADRSMGCSDVSLAHVNRSPTSNQVEFYRPCPIESKSSPDLSRSTPTTSATCRSSGLRR